MPLSLVRLGRDCSLGSDVESLLYESLRLERFGRAMVGAPDEVLAARALPETHPTVSTTDHSVLHGMNLRFLCRLTRYAHRL